MSIPKNIQIPRIAEAIRGVQLTVDVLYNQSECYSRERVLAFFKSTGLVQLGGWPSWSRVRSNSANGRAGRVVDPARPSAELDWFSWSCGQAGRVVDSARPSAELDGVLCPPFNKTGITYATRC
ncbi:hypothetical protein F2Q69_00039869 [Brassica cretica]|uniref:Uncharacterized protein n=1 Tax=Brassica cretica TaxID=69181 RepID=A0A8S9NHQ9_BRACR|nr:hypothetical protein F2Q69_00039869 [Brassica cretica]